MSPALSPVEMQAVAGAYMVLGLFSRCEDLRRLDRLDRASDTPTTS